MVRATIIINGSTTNEFRFHRGLRQGDSLSLFLFILVTKVLHLAMDKVVELGLIEDFQNVILGQIFTHLQFTNNTILFLREDENEVSNAKYILRCFEILLGLSINFKKSCLVGFDVNEEILYRMAAICKCKTRSLPFNYLGIPLGADLRRVVT